MPIRKLWGSSAIRSALGFALGGGGFAVANLLLARTMSPRDYGLVVLFVAITQLGSTLGPAGMDTIAIRHRLGASASLMVRVLLSGTVLGGVAALALTALLHINTGLGYLVIVAVLLASLNRVGCSFMQSLERYRRSLALLMAHNGVLLVATLVLLLLGRHDVETVAVILTAGYALSAAYGWIVARRGLQAETVSIGWPSLRREGFTVVAAQTSTAVLNQLDRMLIPRVLSPGALGEYAATATICASPFNLLQSGARHTLLPKIRRSADRAAALHHIRAEAVATFVIAALAATGCVLLAPLIARWAFAGRYEFDMDLVQLIVGLGVLKLWHGFANSCIQALGSRRSLLRASIAGWCALGIALICVLGIAEPDLTSVVSAIGAGWLTLCVASTFIAWQAFHESATNWVQQVGAEDSLAIAAAGELNANDPANPGTPHPSGGRRDATR